KDFSILSFDQGDAIINAGEQGALLVKAQFDSLAKLQKAAPVARHVDIQDSIYIGNIKIKGNTTYPRDYVRGKLKISTDAKTSYEDLNKGLNNLTATGNFRRVNYELIPRQDKGSDLELIVHEQKNKTSLRASLHYDKLYKSAALLNLTRKSLIFNNVFSSFDFIFGDNLRYKFDYFIDKGNYWSIGLRSRLDQFEQKVGFDFIADK